MRVLVVSHSSAVENLGGAERSLLEFIDGWRILRPDAEFFVIARGPRGHLQPELERLSVPHMMVAFESWVLPRRLNESENILRAARDSFAAVRTIERFILEWKPEVVLTNTIVAPWGAVAAKLAGVPHVWMPSEFGDDHEFQLSVDETFEDIGTMSDLVATASEQLGQYLEQWIDPSKMAVLYPRVDPAGAVAAAASTPRDWVEPFPHSTEMSLKVVCVGRLARSKGQSRLLHAAALLRDQGVDVHVALVGNSATEDAAGIRAFTEELDLHNRVVLTGETANPAAYMARADVGVILSDSEGFGRVAVEMLALGVPIVAARVGATVELVSDGNNGLLTEPGNIEEIAEALKRYAEDVSLRVSHSEAASSAAVEIAGRHPLEALVARVEQTIAQPSLMPRLPHLMMSWMELPTTALLQLGAMGAFVNPQTSRTWRVGVLALAGPRFARRVLGKAARLIRKGHRRT